MFISTTRTQKGCSFVSMKFAITILVVSIYLMQTTFAFKFCDGQFCDNQCQQCDYCVQEKNCKIKQNCYCGSTKIPGNIPRDQAPQFVLFTWDDRLYKEFHDILKPEVEFFNNQIVDANGCKLRPTFYITTNRTDFDYAAYYNKIGEVGLHSINHNTNRNSSKLTFLYETFVGKELIEKFADIDDDDIVTSRAPFLEVCDNYWYSLEKSKIFIDSSVIHPMQYNGQRYWPYTMDYGFAQKWLCSDKQCPTQQYKKLWQFPMQTMADFEINSDGSLNISNYYAYTMDPDVSDYNRTMNIFKKNFAYNYHNGSRAPFGLYVHFHYFFNNGYVAPNNLNQDRVRFVKEFYTWVTQNFPNVIFATEKQIINWMRNPKNFQKTKDLSDFKVCPPNLNYSQGCPSNKPVKNCQITTGDDSRICGNCPLFTHETSLNASEIPAGGDGSVYGWCRQPDGTWYWPDCSQCGSVSSAGGSCPGVDPQPYATMDCGDNKKCGEKVPISYNFSTLGWCKNPNQGGQEWTYESCSDCLQKDPIANCENPYNDPNGYAVMNCNMYQSHCLLEGWCIKNNNDAWSSCASSQCIRCQVGPNAPDVCTQHGAYCAIDAPCESNKLCSLQNTA